MGGGRGSSGGGGGGGRGSSGGGGGRGVGVGEGSGGGGRSSGGGGGEGSGGGNGDGGSSGSGGGGVGRGARKDVQNCETSDSVRFNRRSNEREDSELRGSCMSQTALAPLWTIESDLLALVESVETCPDELREELDAKIAAYVGTEAVKLDHINSVYALLEGQMAACDSELERLTERKRAVRGSKERLDQYLLHVIQLRDGAALEGKTVRFSARHSDAVVILDAAAIPDAYKRTTVVVDVSKDAIKRAIKAGETVPGADLEFRTSLVRR